MKRGIIFFNTFIFYFLFSLYLPVAQEINDDDFHDFGEDQTGITVIGTPETTQQMTLIDKETIEKSAARNLAALLEEEINMSIVSLGGYGNKSEINLRGFDTERIAILIDGVPANSPRSGDFDLNQIDLNNVERIEVIYGGSDTKYNVSGALGGVINIITIKKQNTGLNFGFTLSNTSYLPGKYNLRQAEGAIGKPEFIDLLDTQSLNLFIGQGGKKFSWRTSLFGNRAGNHYLYKDDYNFMRRKISNEVFDTGGNVQLVFNLPNDASLFFDTKAYYAHRNFPITMNAVGSVLATDLIITENILFTAPVVFLDNLATEASLTYQTSFTNYGVNISSNDHYLTVINRWSWFQSEQFTFRSGIDWRFLFIKTESPTEQESVKTGNLGGLYVTCEYNIVKKFLLIGSIKFVTDTKKVSFIPKLGLRWQLNSMFTLKNNYFRSFKFPDFDDLYYNSMDGTMSGNPNLRPEDGCGTDLSGEFKLNEIFYFSSAFFWQYTKDSIHWGKSQGGRWRPENLSQACFTGFDLRPVFTIKINKWKLTSFKISANYQFQYSWLLNDDIKFKNAFRIPYIPMHIIGGSIDLSWKTGSVIVSVYYQSTRYADKENKMILDPYCIINATINQNIGKNLTFFASLRNILNVQYESFASYHMPGISLVCGLRGKFNFKKQEKNNE